MGLTLLVLLGLAAFVAVTYNGLRPPPAPTFRASKIPFRGRSIRRTPRRKMPSPRSCWRFVLR